MKCGVVTLFGTDNYGNRLQNYAVEQLLYELGFDEVHTYVMVQKQNYLVGRGGKLVLTLKGCLPLRILSLCDIIIEKLSDKLVAKRSEQFRKFNRAYIHEKRIYVKTFKDIEKKQEIKSNDFFVVGSDQVWNPRLTGAAPEYFLKFAPCEKRVALSASIGIETIDNQYLDTFKAGIKEMKYISVREDTARNIVQKTTGRVSDVFLDPTFLICVNKWHSLIKKPKYPLPDKYILTFFLREEPKQSVSLCEKMYGYEVIHMNNKNYPEMYAWDPSEFLYMIKNAELILTDSFHATVFSILFHKQFFVYRRKHKNPEYMFTRLSTLLGRFQLDDRIQNREDFLKKCDIPDEKYNIIDNEIQMEQKRVKEILGTIFMG